MCTYNMHLQRTMPRMHKMQSVFTCINFIYVYVHSYTHIYINMYIYTYAIYTHTALTSDALQVQGAERISMYMCTYIHTNICICIYTYIYIYIYT